MAGDDSVHHFILPQLICATLRPCLPGGLICSEFVSPDVLAAFLGCRLIAFDKNPGVRPIGIGEIPRRIVAIAVLSVIGGDIQEAAGSIQLCSGQTSGIEAAVHAMNEAYHDDDVQAVLLVDASNAFNCFNRQSKQ